MHIDDLRALAPLWLSKTEEVRQDKSHWSTNITGDIYGMGWISEMYGYSFGAAEVSSVALPSYITHCESKYSAVCILSGLVDAFIV